MPTKICTECPKEFVPYGGQKTCSLECSQAKIKKYDRARSGKPRGPSIRTAYRRTDEVDPNYWKQIDSRFKAWLLGFVSTDGDVQHDHVRWHIQERDREILEVIKKELGSGATIQTTKTGVALAISSAEWARDLTNMGCGPHKSTTVKWVDLPVEFECDYVRGLMDGDGSVWISMKTTPVAEFYSSSRHLADGFEHFCQIAGYEPRRYERIPKGSQNLFYKIWLRVHDTRDFLERLYRDKQPTILRKQARAFAALAV